MVNLDFIYKFLSLPDQTQAEVTDSAMQSKQDGSLELTSQ